MAGEEDKSKNRGRKTTRALKKTVPSGEVSLDHFIDIKPDDWQPTILSGPLKNKAEVKQLDDPGRKPEKKTRKRRAKTEIEREWRVKTIEKEHKLDGKSMTINLKRCFITNLRVSQDVWEEVRARTIERLEQWSREAEERAQKKGKKTIQMEDLI